MKSLTRIIHRIVQILSVALLFVVRPIIVPILFNIVVMSVMLLNDRKKGNMFFDFLSFALAYILMFFTALIFPNLELLPHTPHFIYPALTFITVLSLVIKRPITSGQAFKKSYGPANAIDYINTGVWATAFLSATFCSFYFFPKSEYLIYSFYALGSGIAVRIIIWILGKMPKHVTTIAK